jgi:hypothetical protein
VDPLQTVFLASFMTTSEPSGRMTRQSWAGSSTSLEEGRRRRRPLASSWRPSGRRSTSSTCRCALSLLPTRLSGWS